jgi:hypothetical protein
MKWLGIVPVLAISLYACTDADPASVDALQSDVEMSASAYVLNRGNGQPSATAPCNFGPFLTLDNTNIRTPGGAQLLTCKFRDLPPVDRTVHVKGYRCYLPGGAITYDSHWRRTPAGTGMVTCIYKGR